MALDMDTLPPKECRAGLCRCEAQPWPKEEEGPELPEDFDVEWYRRYWTKK